ncbi:MAG: peptidylprolyl isomerase [Vibrio metschnikovii]|uniref:peptidylprolyl isomerase n=1 Tax=Vibrio metschnikovii TaxID=28172 RepID=UPI001645992F|nr:peptidylprolyl isomerase [Vibrio metschnikovii]MBC3621859.1 peptidylprolyl isomerase [Vibrio metschnikovii]MDM7485687.1 peptidylprolyl isomerase [Vibrio metschnikovii]
MVKKIAAAILTMFSITVWAQPQVKFETSIGDFIVELDSQLAPITSENFLHYVQDGSYIGSQFHRVIPGFMAQGGGFDAKLEPLKTNPPIVNEARNGLRNDTATIAMARTANPNSATRQFFINLADNQFLNPTQRQEGYAVFGKVISGFETIQMMAKQPTRTIGHLNDVPVTPIVITNVTVIID